MYTYPIEQLSLVLFEYIGLRKNWVEHLTICLTTFHVFNILAYLYMPQIGNVISLRHGSSQQAVLSLRNASSEKIRIVCVFANEKNHDANLSPFTKSLSTECCMMHQDLVVHAVLIRKKMFRLLTMSLLLPQQFAHEKESETDWEPAALAVCMGVIVSRHE